MIIATANSKGGVGKSTLAVHLAVWLYDQGLSVILIDSDMQQSSSRWIAIAEPNIKTICMTDPNEILDDAYKLTEQAEIVVADGPAGVAELTRALLGIADMALVPCGPSGLDIEATSITVRLINQMRRIRKENSLPHAIFIANKVQTNTLLSKELLDAGESVGIPVAHTPIRLRQIYADAPGQRTVVWRMGYKGKEAANDMHALFEEVLHYGREQKD